MHQEPILKNLDAHDVRIPTGRVPLVSIGLPLYNAEKYLTVALDALLAQTFTDFELIISDNASTDRTDEICRKYAARDARIRYVRNEKNFGAVANYNRTVELARGKYFRWATYDDLVAPELLERCVEVLEKEDDVVMCYPKTIDIDEQGNVLGNYEDNFEFTAEEPQDRFRDLMKVVGDYDCNAEYGVMRREVLLKTGMEQSYHSADKVLLSELVLHGKFREVPERLFYHRHHASTTTVQGWTGAQFLQFLDTSKKGKFAFPRLRRFVEFIRSINRSNIPIRKRIPCYGQVILFYLEPERWKRLLGLSKPTAG